MGLTVEPQYGELLSHRADHGVTRLGLMTAHAWHEDPKRFAFTASRYKFVAKMLAGKQSVLEIGCADAFFTRIVQQSVGSVTAIDIDPVFIADAHARMDEKWPFKLLVRDILSGPVRGPFDAAYSLDVLEHISPDLEATFMANLATSLTDEGVAIIGMPSLESQAYASPISKAGHVNCKTGADLAKLCGQWFDNVFSFSMNDEVVHTGHSAMANYLLALCVGPRC